MDIAGAAPPSTVPNESDRASCRTTAPDTTLQQLVVISGPAGLIGGRRLQKPIGQPGCATWNQLPPELQTMVWDEIEGGIKCHFIIDQKMFNFGWKRVFGHVEL